MTGAIHMQMWFKFKLIINTLSIELVSLVGPFLAGGYIMGENVKVVVRCRPMSRKERDSKCENIVEIGDYCVSVLNPLDRNAPRKTFTFDSVYAPQSKTEVIYNDMIYSLVESSLEGYNGTIFAYGQTGCGKTHTMQGADSAASDGSEYGIIPRCFDHIFETISMAKNVRYLALVSYLEIYNENIRDLLSTNAAVNHQLKDVPGVGITVPTLSAHTVVNKKECHNLLNIGNGNRITAATLMNEKSSRSHTIFTISLEQINGAADVTLTSEEEAVPFADGGIRRGKLNLVDLAGSERQRKTGAAGDRLKEATKINLSLSALGNVISSLVDGKTKHVPYRDSKLTRLLQDSLGGNTKTLMISCISPADGNYDETLSTLRYACRAKNISNIPRINEDPKDAKLRLYQDEILKLKKLLDESKLNESDRFTEESTRKLWLEEERVKLRQQIKEEELQSSHTHSKQIETATNSNSNEEELQLQARQRIDNIKIALIGGERANDTQLRERHRKRKIEAQRHLSAIAHALSRVEQGQDRDLLQVHYATIQQEINVKNEHIKKCFQRIKMLEREVSDLNSEFQLDREDYLDEIRQLGRNVQFYRQLFNTAQPVLRKNGKHWEAERILEKSNWNDDHKIWTLPVEMLQPLKLPPAIGSASINRNSNIALQPQDEKEDSAELYKVNILNNYFRPNRQKSQGQRSRSSQAWQDIPILKSNILNNNKMSNLDGTISKLQNSSKSWSAVMDKLFVQQLPNKTNAWATEYNICKENLQLEQAEENHTD